MNKLVKSLKLSNSPVRTRTKIYTDKQFKLNRQTIYNFSYTTQNTGKIDKTEKQLQTDKMLSK